MNADNKNVSDRALQEAEARAKSEDARLQAATGTVELIENALSAGAAAVKPVPVVVEHGGEVVELLARPGESVESGQTILRVMRFDRLIARVDVPAGQNVAPSVSTARILALGNEDRPLQGERVGLAAAIDPNTQGQSFLFRVSDPAGALRPGLAVTAWLRLPGAREKGVLLPANAVIHAAGKAWTYVQVKPDQFVRKEVREGRPAGPGWFTTGFSPGDRVVVTGAQVLLSEQSKSEIRVGEEGSGH
jgi:multidrug efflux pump subunit AcrA (membrane-fusion protein)